MVFKRSTKRYRYRKTGWSNVPSKLKKVRKMVGNTPETWTDKISRYGGAIGKIAKTVSMLSNFINVEVKYYDKAQVATNLFNDGAYSYVLNDVPQGDGEGQRDGEKIVFKNLIVKYSILANSGQPTTQAMIAIILDKKPEVGAVVWTSVYNSNQVIPLINRDNSDRFVILKSIFVNMNNSGNLSRMGTINVNLSRIHEKFNSATGTDIESNRLHIIAISDKATDQPTLQFNSRLNYYDN